MPAIKYYNNSFGHSHWSWVKLYAIFLDSFLASSSHHFLLWFLCVVRKKQNTGIGQEPEPFIVYIARNWKSAHSCSYLQTVQMGKITEICESVLEALQLPVFAFSCSNQKCASCPCVIRRRILIKSFAVVSRIALWFSAIRLSWLFFLFIWHEANVRGKIWNAQKKTIVFIGFASASTSSCGSFIKQFSVFKIFYLCFKWNKVKLPVLLKHVRRDTQINFHFKRWKMKTHSICELTFSVDLRIR